MNEYDSNRIYDLTSTIGFNKTNIKKKLIVLFSILVTYVKKQQKKFMMKLEE